MDSVAAQCLTSSPLSLFITLFSPHLSFLPSFLLLPPRPLSPCVRPNPHHRPLSSSRRYRPHRSVLRLPLRRLRAHHGATASPSEHRHHAAHGQDDRRGKCTRWSRFHQGRRRGFRCARQSRHSVVNPNSRVTNQKTGRQLVPGNQKAVNESEWWTTSLIQLFAESRQAARGSSELLLVCCKSDEKQV